MDDTGFVEILYDEDGKLAVISVKGKHRMFGHGNLKEGGFPISFWEKDPNWESYSFKCVNYATGQYDGLSFCWMSSKYRAQFANSDVDTKPTLRCNLAFHVETSPDGILAFKVAYHNLCTRENIECGKGVTFPFIHQ